MEPSYTPLGEVVFEGRGLTPDDLWGPSVGAWRDFQSASGERVDAETAMRSIAVQAAIRLLVNDIGSLPVDAFRRQTEGRTQITPPIWVDDPNPLNPNATWEDHI